jgi:hypothetical protein
MPRPETRKMGKRIRKWLGGKVLSAEDTYPITLGSSGKRGPGFEAREIPALLKDPGSEASGASLSLVRGVID